MRTTRIFNMRTNEAHRTSPHPRRRADPCVSRVAARFGAAANKKRNAEAKVASAFGVPLKREFDWGSYGARSPGGSRSQGSLPEGGLSRSPGRSKQGTRPPSVGGATSTFPPSSVGPPVSGFAASMGVPLSCGTVPPVPAVPAVPPEPPDPPVPPAPLGFLSSSHAAAARRRKRAPKRHTQRRLISISPRLRRPWRAT
jgi:hypothetical protein